MTMMMATMAMIKGRDGCPVCTDITDINQNDDDKGNNDNDDDNYNDNDDADDDDEDGNDKGS